MSDNYDETLRSIQDWIEENLIGSQPIGAATLVSAQECIRDVVARKYDVPLDWVSLHGVRFADGRTSIVCEGFTITPGGLDFLV